MKLYPYYKLIYLISFKTRIWDKNITFLSFYKISFNFLAP